jgi:hypothetical protein
MNHQNKFLFNADKDCQAIPHIKPQINQQNDKSGSIMVSPSNYWDDNTDEYKDDLDSGFQDPLSNALQSICLMQIMRDGRC